MTGSAEELKTKAELSKALADSFAFCDGAFENLNDQTGAAAVTIEFINNMPSTKLGMLAFNSAHDWEHYGNIVTYLRLNKIVPPSTAAQGGQSESEARSDSAGLDAQQLELHRWHAPGA